MHTINMVCAWEISKVSIELIALIQEGIPQENHNLTKSIPLPVNCFRFYPYIGWENWDFKHICDEYQQT